MTDNGIQFADLSKSSAKLEDIRDAAAFIADITGARDGPRDRVVRQAAERNFQIIEAGSSLDGAPRDI